MIELPGGSQQVEDALDDTFRIYERHGITKDEAQTIKCGYETWFLYQLQSRNGKFYEEAKELIECNAIVRSINAIRAHLEEIGKLPKEDDYDN